jgi:HEPN domain-containing protein
LAKVCEEISSDLAPFKDDLKLIDEFYIPTRYPDAIPGGRAERIPLLEDAWVALETAAKVLDLVKNRI